jgi:hypothetical protein
MFQVLCACRREFVNPNAAVCSGDAPLGLDQVFFEKALESWIQRPLFDLEQVMGGSLNMLYQRVSVRRLPSQGLENHHLQSTRKEVSPCGFLHVTESLRFTY